MNVPRKYVNYFCNIYEYYEEKLNTFLKNYLGETDVVFPWEIENENEPKRYFKKDLDCLRNSVPDPRTSQWPFTTSPIPLLIIFSLYYITAIFGPRIMKSRKALEIRKVLMVYNVSQILLSSFIMKEIIVSSYQGGFSFTCQPVDVSMNPIALRMAGSSWWYHISKYVDLLDTVFFVLRKKGKQMSFLHLFHHSTMLFNSYLGLLYIPGGQAIVSTFLNSFVHVIMYWYYLLSAVGPRFHKYLWWKKYLTILQLTQFFTVLAHVFLGSFSGCEVPNWLKIYVICYVSVLIVLFLNFYLSSYKKMSLLKALGCVCFQNHLKKSPSESKNDPLDIQNKIEKDLKDEIKFNDLIKREGIKAKSPFTVVSRNATQDISEETYDECTLKKNKDI